MFRNTHLGFGGVSTARLWGLDAQCPIVHEAASASEQGEYNNEELLRHPPRSEHHVQQPSPLLAGQPRAQGPGVCVGLGDRGWASQARAAARLQMER